MKRLQSFLPLLLVFCAALLVRILYNFTAGRGYVAMYDAAQYERLALNLLNEHCFCDVPHVSMTARPPLWPTIIAVVYAIFGANNLSARLFLSVLGSGTCVLVYCFCRDLFGKRLAVIAGLFAAIYPGLFVYDGWLYSESVYTFFLLAFTYTLYLFQRTAQTRWMILSGITLGLSALTRQNGLVSLVLLLIWAIVVGWQHIQPWRVVLKGILIMALLTLMLVVPWSIRNYVVSHKIVPIATGGSTILSGAYNDTVLNNPGYLGGWVVPTLASPPIVSHTKCCNIWGENQDQEDYAFHWMETHLDKMPYLLTLHFINIWKPSLPDGILPVDQFPSRLSSQIIRRMMRYMPPLIFALTALGLIATWKKKRKELLPIYLVLLFTIAQCIAFYGSVRFRAPIEPLLVILATGFLWWLGKFLTSQRQMVTASESTGKADSIVQETRQVHEVQGVGDTSG